MVVTITYIDSGIYHTLQASGTGTVTDDDFYQYLYTLAGDAETYMSRTGSVGSYVYTLKLQSGENYVRTTINSGVTWQREQGATWNQEFHLTSSSTYYTLYIQSGSTLQLADDCVFNAASNSPTYGRAYLMFYGTLLGIQTSGHPAIFENYRSCYWYMYDSTPWDLDYVTFRNVTYSGGYLIYLGLTDVTSYDGSKVAHSLKHITISDTRGYGIPYMRFSDYSSWIIEDWTIDNIEEFNFTHNKSVKFVRLTIQDTDDYTRLYDNGQSVTESRIYTSKTKDWNSSGYNQAMIFFDTPTFDNCDNGVYNFLTYCGGLYLIKDGTTQNAQYGYYANDSIIMLYGTQTYTNITTLNKRWGGSGTFLHVRKLNLTINDPAGQPLENARVSIRTKLTKTVNGRDYPYEEYSFLTDENG